MKNFNNTSDYISFKYINITLYGLIKMLKKIAFVKTSDALTKAYVTFLKELDYKCGKSCFHKKRDKFYS